MDIRAYGFVLIDANNIEDALKTVTAKYVANQFSPHGGSDDLDYDTPVNIVIMDEVEDDQGNMFTVKCQIIPNGAWAS